MTKKLISIFADEQEFKDFQFVKEKLERKTDADTVRAMISFCKKFLGQNIATRIIQYPPQQ